MTTLEDQIDQQVKLLDSAEAEAAAEVEAQQAQFAQFFAESTDRLKTLLPTGVNGQAAKPEDSDAPCIKFPVAGIWCSLECRAGNVVAIVKGQAIFAAETNSDIDPDDIGASIAQAIAPLVRSGEAVLEKPKSVKKTTAE